MGQFVTPDWSAVPAPAPYADLTDPQTLNQYSYVRNIPTVRVDVDGHDGCCSLSEILTFAAGAANALGSDNLMGAGRMEQTTTAGKLGAEAGDAVAALQGAYELMDGGFKAVGGFFLDEIGAGEVVQGIGVAESLHGVGVGVTAFAHLARNASENNGGSVPNPDGSKGASDHQTKVNELVDKAKGEAKAGETVESNKQVKGVDSTRRPDAQIVDAKRKTRKVFEAERHPNRARNKKREAEYKKLKLKNETHPLK